MLHLSVTLRSSESVLLGGDYEFSPVIKYWAPWGQHRLVQESAPLQTSETIALQPLTLPSPDRVRGDERVWFEQWPRSKKSGIPSIDAQEKGRVLYEAQAGLKDVPLFHLLQLKPGQVLEAPLMDPQLLLAVASGLQKDVPLSKDWTEQQKEEYILKRAYKGTLLITAKVVGAAPNQLYHLMGSLQKKGQGEHAGHLMYGSPRMLAAMQQAQLLLLTEYSNHYYGRFHADGTAAGPPTYALGPEKSLEHMHLPTLQSKFGVLPPVALGQQRVHQREGMAATMSEEEQKFYGPTREAALVVNKMVASSCLRAGMTPAHYVAAIQAQDTQSPSDASLSEDYLDALLITVDVGTSRGNNLNYMKDLRYPNRATLTPEQEKQLLNESQKVETDGHASLVALKQASRLARASLQTLQLHGDLSHPFFYLSRCHGRKRRVYWGYQQEPIKESEDTTVSLATLDVEVESMDPVGIHGHSWNDDCEGSAEATADLMRQIPELATMVTAEEAPLLHAAARVARHYLVFEAVASVSAAFVDTSGAELSKDALKAMKDLPLIGDVQDTRRKVGGHCPAMYMSEACVTAALERAGHDIQQELPHLAKRQFTAWQKRLPVLMLEGTASIDPLVLPVGEVAKAVLKTGAAAQAYEAKAAARKAFIKDLMPTREGATKPALLQYTHAEGLSFYTGAQDPKRRVSSFYMGISHFISVQLAQKNPRFGQLSVVNPQARTRGGEVAEVMRMPYGQSNHLGLAATYGGITKEQWDKQIRPVMEVIQNQIPLASVDFYPTAQAAETAAMRIGSILPPTLLAQGVGINGQPVATTLDKYAQQLQKQLGKAAHHPLQGALHRLAASQGQVAPVLNQNSQSPTSVPGKTLCFTVPSWTYQEPGAMADLVHDLKERVAARSLSHYAIVADRPLQYGQDVISVVVTLASSTINMTPPMGIAPLDGNANIYISSPGEKAGFARFEQHVHRMIRGAEFVQVDKVRDDRYAILRYLHLVDVLVPGLHMGPYEIQAEQSRGPAPHDTLARLLWRCLGQNRRDEWIQKKRWTTLEQFPLTNLSHQNTNNPVFQQPRPLRYISDGWLVGTRHRVVFYLPVRQGQDGTYVDEQDTEELAQVVPADFVERLQLALDRAMESGAFHPMPQGPPPAAMGNDIGRRVFQYRGLEAQAEDVPTLARLFVEYDPDLANDL